MLLGGELGEDERQLRPHTQPPLLDPAAAANLPLLYGAPQPEEPQPTPVGAPVDGHVTHYGEAYNGQSLGCGVGVYSSEDETIAAVGPAHDAEWPCGADLRICGPAGCAIVQRKDGCPGCSAYVIDLSEAGVLKVCGPGSGVCRATIQPMAR